MKKLLLTLCLTFLATTGVFAVTGRQEVLDAIAVLENPTDGESLSKAMSVVIQFAQESPDVLITISRESAPWIFEDLKLSKENTDMVNSLLLAEYVAGMVKYQLATGTMDENPYEGWLFVIRSYNQLKEQLGFTSPELEDFIRKEAEGVLKDYGQTLVEQHKEKK
ncbi:MAG: hypothetical protein WC360_04035 [Opitutales bacterium]|jgi:hypothetical protein